MKTLKELEDLLIAEYTKVYGRQANALDAGVVGSEVGLLYGIISCHPSAFAQLEKAIADKRKALENAS